MPSKLLIAAGLALVLAAPAHAQDARGIAGALRSDPVYVHPDARSLVSERAAGRIRLRIARRDPGRIRIAIVPAAGSLEALANAVDHALKRRGVLLVTTGPALHVVTSYTPVDPTLTAVRGAVQAANGRSLAARLLAAVDAAATVDPGPGGDLAAREPAALDDGGIGDLTDGIRLWITIGVVVVVAAIVLPFLIPAALAARHVLRLRRRWTERRALHRRDARDELIALGDEIRALDIDVSLPGADERGRDEYARALELYDRANRALSGDEVSETEMFEAQRALDEARKRIEAARTLLAETPVRR